MTTTTGTLVAAVDVCVHYGPTVALAPTTFELGRGTSVALERQLARAQTAAQDLVALTRELATKETRHDQLVAELRSIPSGFDERRHAALEREMDRLAPLNEQAARLSARIDREVVQREEYEAVSVKLAAARALVADLSARYAETKVSEREMQRQREAYETTVATLRQAELELQAATSEEVRAAEAVATAERDRLELDRAVALHARLDADRRLHDELDRAYTDLRTDLNFQLRPELSDLASQFLNQLTDGRYAELELDDQYSLVVLEDGVPKPVISGGEEDLSNLVLRLAISQMIADRSGQNFSLLVLDEVFGSLDVARRQNVVDLLRRLEGRFEQVILITHIEGVKDELDHVVLVDYDDQVGSTRVRHAELAIPDFEGLDAEEVPAGAET
jgi:exonuclease SbcC